MQSSTALRTCPKCSTDLTPYTTLPIPPAFCLQCKFPLMLIANKYRLERVLGEGGFGTVYLAKHVRLERNAERVVKLLKPEVFQMDGMERRFSREVQLTSDLSQKNDHIVRIFDDFGEEEHLGHFYVMEYLEGRTLSEYISHPNAVPHISWSLAIFKQLCDAMQAAHEDGIIHRDLKPENIILIPKRKHPYFVKVLDFGIAKPMQSGAETAKLTQGALGTPYYMSPEQTINKPVDARSDLYSMGIMLFELLTGQHPFIPKGREADISVMELMSAHMMQDVPDPAALFPERHIPSSLGQIVIKACAKDANERFQSAEALWDSIERAAGALTHVEPEELHRFLPSELRQRPSEQIKLTASHAFAATVEPGADLIEEASSRATPSASYAHLTSSPSRKNHLNSESYALQTPEELSPQPSSQIKRILPTGLSALPSSELHERVKTPVDVYAQTSSSTLDAATQPSKVPTSSSWGSRVPQAQFARSSPLPKEKALWQRPIVWLGLLILLISAAVLTSYAMEWFDPFSSKTYTHVPKRLKSSSHASYAVMNSKRRIPPMAALPTARPTPLRHSVPKSRTVRRIKAVKRSKQRPKARRRHASSKRKALQKRHVRAARRGLCPKAHWVQLRIQPCSHGVGAIRAEASGFAGGQGRVICVPPKLKIIIEQTRCASCIFSVPRKKKIQLRLKNRADIDIDTGHSCLQ